MPKEARDNQYERWFGLIAGALIVAFIMAIIWRDKPFTSPDLARMARIVLALGAGAVGATIPGFLRIDYKSGALAVRAAGGLAVFLIVYFGSPKVEALHLSDPVLVLEPVNWIEFRAAATPATGDELDLDAPSTAIIDLRATNYADQLGKQIVIDHTSVRVFIDGKTPDNFPAKYFVQMISGGTLYGGTAESKLGLQGDASAISLSAGESIEKSILHVSEKVGMPDYASRWRDIVDAVLDRKLGRAEVELQVASGPRYLFECTIDRDKTRYLVTSWLDEKGVYPRYFHAMCLGDQKWSKSD